MTKNEEEQDEALGEEPARLTSTAHSIFVPMQSRFTKPLPPASHRIQRLERVLEMHDAHVAEVRANITRLVERECARIIHEAAAEEAAEKKRIQAEQEQRQRQSIAEPEQSIWPGETRAGRQDAARGERLPLPPHIHVVDPRNAFAGMSAAEYNLIVHNVQSTEMDSSPASLAPSPAPPADAVWSRRQEVTRSLLQCTSQALRDLDEHDARNHERRQHYQDLLDRELQDKAR
ncbi:hypothetical protein CDD81_3315 [Ophiocordyceps australis]|uniref:Uncharacterized protein n=1 Tax=Ophiocordyceps australis TaxID=1399860 RepID=A0A2C5YDX3_9HYPO|nr:hypothetical protein CDD81_3315 [Ophiocordyceps australis]